MVSFFWRFVGFRILGPDDRQYLVHLFFRKLLFLGKVSQHAGIGIVEILFYDIAKSMLLIVLFGHYRVITKSVPEGLMIQKAFFFQDADHRRNGVIVGL